MSEWYFRPKVPGEPNREPVHGEFFAADAISDPGRALVREGIQNALDAANQDHVVLVRVFLSNSKQAVLASQAALFFIDSWNHLRAESNGLHAIDLPASDSPCNFLAFEDFGTSGLTGDPAEPFQSRQGGKNHFYHFFRAEGQSDKGASDRGSWGVGKQVFLRASRIGMLFGLTVPATDNQRMLMGKCVLKSHWIGDHYYQDGYFGSPPSNDRELVLPVTDSILIDEFAKLFDLQRGKSSGLSLVIPWPDPEITDKAITRAVLQDYFYPILAGQLEVIVEAPSIKTVLDASTLVKEVDRLDPRLADDLKPLIQLARWARLLQTHQRIVIRRPDANSAWKWSESLFENGQLEALRSAYDRGEQLAIRVPVTVRKRDGSAKESWFDVYLVRDSSEQPGRPTFIREGIIISRVDSPRSRGVRALVIADDVPLAGFLRTAENPSHTEWQHVRLRDEYRFGYKTDLEFVKRSVHEIVNLLTAARKDEDPTLLADFFSIRVLPEEESAKTKQRNPRAQPGPDSAPPEPPALHRPQRFRIEKINIGFSLLPGADGAVPPARLDIRVAYDIRRGNPLKKYNPADFQVDRAPIRFEPESHGVDIAERINNRIVVAIRNPDFALHVTGFDGRRQIYVRAIPREAIDDDSQA